MLPAFKLGADVVIAVDITAGLDDAKRYNRGVDIMVRANAIKDWALVSHLRSMADVLIEPDIRRVHWADFAAFDQCIEAGDEAATAAIPQIRQLLRSERLLSIVRRGACRRRAEMQMQAREFAICVE